MDLCRHLRWKTFSRGGTLDLTIRALGFDLSLGEPIFTLEGDAPSGMSLDGRSGKLNAEHNSAAECAHGEPVARRLPRSLGAEVEI